MNVPFLPTGPQARLRASRFGGQVRQSLKIATAGLGAACLLLIVYAFTNAPASIEGRLLPQHVRGFVPWVTISAQQIHSGATLPAHTNVIIHIPDDVSKITRGVLFGERGKNIRYWGYCFPEENDRQTAAQLGRAFPGTLFLSEAERAAKRTRYEQEKKRTFSVFKHLSTEELNEETDVRGRIRHQMELFRAGMSCYVMTEKPIPVGTDRDDDGLNASLEKDFGSNPRNPDSDGDGVPDGAEVFLLGTHPMRRDSDGDGVIDGMEDINQNGHVDKAETHPMQWDTDRDGLCDGLCKVNRGTELRGEDKNLNGKVDAGEYDPRKGDTDGDGVLDEQEYYRCFLAGGSNC